MKLLYSYLAGLIDADGSIYVRLKKNLTHRFDFQIVPCVVIFQHQQNYCHLQLIQKKLKYGSIRKRNDKMLELTFSRHQDIYHLLTSIKPFLLIKKDQANLALSILSDLKQIQNADDFMSVAEKVDRFQKLNFSVNRKNNAQMVGNHLKNLGILTP